MLYNSEIINFLKFFPIDKEMIIYKAIKKIPNGIFFYLNFE